MRVRSGRIVLAGAFLFLLLTAAGPAASAESDIYIHVAEALFAPLAGGRPVSFRQKPSVQRTAGKVTTVCRDLAVPLGNTGAVLAIQSLRLEFDEEQAGEVPFKAVLPSRIQLRLTDRAAIALTMTHPVLAGILDPVSGRVIKAEFAAEHLTGEIGGRALEAGSLRYGFGLEPGKEGVIEETLRYGFDDLKLGAAVTVEQGRYAVTSVFETAEAFDQGQAVEPAEAAEGGLKLSGLRLRILESVLPAVIESLQLGFSLETAADGEGQDFNAEIGFTGAKFEAARLTAETGKLHLGLGAARADKIRALLAGAAAGSALFENAAMDLLAEHLTVAGAKMERAHLTFSVKDLEEAGASARFSYRASGLRMTEAVPPVGAATELAIEDLPSSLFRAGYAGEALLPLLDKAGTSIAVKEFSVEAGPGQLALTGKLNPDADVSFGATGQLDGWVRGYDELAASILPLAPPANKAGWQRAAALFKSLGGNAPKMNYAVRIEPSGNGSVNGKDLDAILSRIMEWPRQ